MLKNIYILHMYVTRILLVTCLTYVFVSQSCPACQGRLKHDSPAFFSAEFEKATDIFDDNEQILNQEIEVLLDEEDTHA